MSSLILHLSNLSRQQQIQVFPQYICEAGHLLWTLVWDGISYCSRWPQTCYVAKDDLNLRIFLLLPRECWDYRCAQAHQVYVVLDISDRFNLIGLCWEKHSTVLICMLDQMIAAIQQSLALITQTQLLESSADVTHTLTAFLVSPLNGTKVRLHLCLEYFQMVFYFQVLFSWSQYSFYNLKRV